MKQGLGRSNLHMVRGCGWERVVGGWVVGRVGQGWGLAAAQHLQQLLCATVFNTMQPVQIVV